jgi:hypothetical protein
MVTTAVKDKGGAGASDSGASTSSGSSAGSGSSTGSSSGTDTSRPDVGDSKGKPSVDGSPASKDGFGDVGDAPKKKDGPGFPSIDPMTGLKVAGGVAAAGGAALAIPAIMGAGAGIYDQVAGSVPGAVDAAGRKIDEAGNVIEDVAGGAVDAAGNVVSKIGQGIDGVANAVESGLETGLASILALMAPPGSVMNDFLTLMGMKPPMPPPGGPKL